MIINYEKIWGYNTLNKWRAVRESEVSATCPLKKAKKLMYLLYHPRAIYSISFFFILDLIVYSSVIILHHLYYNFILIIGKKMNKLRPYRYAIRILT